MRLTVEQLTSTLFCVTEQMPRRLEREHYVVQRGSAFTDDCSGRLVARRISDAIRRSTAPPG